MFVDKKYIMPRTTITVSEARDIIEKEGLIDKPLTNKKFGIIATISKRSAKKMADAKSTKQSINPRLHAKAIANIDILFKNAESHCTHSDYRNNEYIEQIHRLGSLMFDEITGQFIFIKITLKEFKDVKGTRIYTIEAVGIEKLNSAGQPTEPFMDSSPDYGVH